MDNTANGVRVLDQYVLVKQTMRKKKTRIVMDGAKDDRDKFDYHFEVVAKGSKCEREISVGDSPIFSEHVRFSGIKVIEKNENGMISAVLVHEGDIIGIDLEAKPLDISSPSKLVQE